MNIKRFSIFLSSALALGALSTVASDAIAAAATDNLNVTASVAASCTISAGTVAFGLYDPITTNAGNPLDADGTVTVTCTMDDTVEITLGQGSNADTGSTDAVPLRQMANGANFLKYFLFSNSERNAVWGATTETDVEHIGTGTATALTVYGRVTQGQVFAPAGSYSDTVVATVTF